MEDLIKAFLDKEDNFKLVFRFVDGTDFDISSTECEIKLDKNFVILSTEGLSTVINLDNVTSFDITNLEI